jgi:ATP-dependent Clp protease ATP-binding subunit ClpA
MMFERFTDRARRVVVLAQEEARMLNHNYIGTEHVLLGLVHEGEGVAAKALESLGISLEGVRARIEEIIGQGEKAPTGHIPFTPRAKKALELSLREALQLGHNYIGTEHVLLGVIREGDGIGCRVLVELGAELTRVRQAIIQLLNGTVESTKAPVDMTLTELDEAISKARRDKESAIDALDYEKAASLRDREKQLVGWRSTMEKLQKVKNKVHSAGTQSVVEEAIKLARIFDDYDFSPNSELVARLIEWKTNGN